MIIVYMFLFLSMFVSITMLFAFIQGLRKGTKPLSGTEKKVTVLIPAYNEEKSISKTIESVLKLDYPRKNLQIIVVDDGSIDNTLQVINKYKRRGVLVLHKENQGCKAYALNYGLKYATGEYIFELDADMFPYPGTIRKMLAYFDDPQVMGVAPAHHIYQPNTFWLKLQVFEYTLASFIRKGLHYIGALNVTPGAAMYKKEFFDKHGGFDGKCIVEDFEMGMRINAERYKIAHAIDTRVDVVSPGGIKSLFKQRLRWAYGHFEVFKKYYFMFSPARGDLGFFYLPVTLLFMFTPFIMFLRVLVNYGNNLIHKGEMFSEIGYDFSYSIANYRFTYAYQPYHFVVVLSFILAIGTYYLIKHIVKPSYSFGPMFIVYLFFYLLFLAVVNVVAAVYYFSGKHLSWTAEKATSLQQSLKRN